MIWIYEYGRSLIDSDRGLDELKKRCVLLGEDLVDGVDGLVEEGEFGLLEVVPVDDRLMSLLNGRPSEEQFHQFQFLVLGLLEDPEFACAFVGQVQLDFVFWAKLDQLLLGRGSAVSQHVDQGVREVVELDVEAVLAAEWGECLLGAVADEVQVEVSFGCQVELDLLQDGGMPLHRCSFPDQD